VSIRASRSVPVRSVVDGLVPYAPGRPVEEVQRELGLARVVKLASNEGPFGPFPAAAEAIERCIPELNRYPDGGTFRVRRALAERHDIDPESVVVCAGADAVVGFVSQALLDPGDEVVTGWPSFPSYVIDAVKMGASAVRVPLRDDRLDLEAIRSAVTERTKIVYLALPNNPTGTSTSRAALAAFLADVPEGVLTVVDQAYFEYVVDPDYPDAIEEHVKAGRNVLVLRTFSKIYGLAGLRIGYGVGPLDVVGAIGKTRRPFDVTTVAQEAALASLDDSDELARRRAVNLDALAALDRALRSAGLVPAGRACGNFLFVEVGDGAPALADALLREGVIVRPLAGFGAPGALRISTGTLEEIAFFAEALKRLPPTVRGG
jgi:histidinol-phosphate aminotransferase